MRALFLIVWSIIFRRRGTKLVSGSYSSSLTPDRDKSKYCQPIIKSFFNIDQAETVQILIEKYFKLDVTKRNNLEAQHEMEKGERILVIVV